MAKFAEIMRFLGKVQGGLGESCVNAFAKALCWNVVEARKTIDQYGTGMLYTRGNVVVEDTPRNRTKLRSQVGYAVALLEDGTIDVIARKPTGGVKRVHRRAEKRKRMMDISEVRCADRSHEARCREEAQRCEEEAEAYRERKQREALFSSCQGKPSPKHQGRANSLDDLGKFKETRFSNRLNSVSKTIGGSAVLRKA